MSKNKQTNPASTETPKSSSAYYVPLLRSNAEAVREAMSIRRAERVAAGGRAFTKADTVIETALNGDTPLQTTTLAQLCGVAQSYACRCLAEIASLANLAPVQDGRRLRKTRARPAAAAAAAETAGASSAATATTAAEA